jgi:predicted DNA-binding transcriptional regulator
MVHTKMRRLGLLRDKGIEKAVQEILKSKAKTRIYVYLLRKNGAKAEDIIKGTRLHPSTVRETLSKMYDDKQISRKKIKNDSIGKNPFMYYPIPPVELLKRHTDEIEERLNQLALLSFQKHNKKSNSFFRIKIVERVEEL